MQRSNRYLFVLCIILVTALLISWIGFIVYESQFETVHTEQTVEQDADSGFNQFIGGDYNGETTYTYVYDQTRP